MFWQPCFRCQNSKKTSCFESLKTAPSWLCVGGRELMFTVWCIQIYRPVSFLRTICIVHCSFIRKLRDLGRTHLLGLYLYDSSYVLLRILRSIYLGGGGGGGALRSKTLRSENSPRGAASRERQRYGDTMSSFHVIF